MCVRKVNCLVYSAVLFGLVALPALAQHEAHGDRQHGQAAAAPSAPAKCPVSDEPANLAVSVETDEGPVFFCCPNCIGKYQADPSKYAEKVAAQRHALEGHPRIQVTCPVTREPVDPKVFVETAGKKVYFCCKGCIGKYQADPGQYASALANSYTYQTKCPVMGEEIDPKSFAAAGNKMKIYFCCKGCDKKFFADPAKYSANLAAQGFTVQPKDLTPGAAVEKKGHDHSGHDHDH